MYRPNLFTLFLGEWDQMESQENYKIIKVLNKTLTFKDKHLKQEG